MGEIRLQTVGASSDDDHLLLRGMIVRCRHLELIVVPAAMPHSSWANLSVIMKGNAQQLPSSVAA